MEKIKDLDIKELLDRSELKFVYLTYHPCRWFRLEVFLIQKGASRTDFLVRLVNYNEYTSVVIQFTTNIMLLFGSIHSGISLV